MADAGRMHHDMGGRDAGPVDQGGHSHPEWEKRVDALMMLLSNSKRRVIGVDELRRGIEELGAENYSKMTYYERWVSSITHNLLEKGIILPQSCQVVHLNDVKAISSFFAVSINFEFVFVIRQNIVKHFL